jgi:trehalose utilization protein
MSSPSDARRPIRVTVWNEYRHERNTPAIAEIYPRGMHEAIADHLRHSNDLRVRTAHLDLPEHGLSESVLAETDVLVWWGHMNHEDVGDAIVSRVHERVLAGMGLVALHSGHFSKIFKRLMGTTCDLKWRVGDDREILWVVRPGHPLLKGIDGDHFILPREEMYGEYFDVPQPDEVVLISSFTGGEVFRSLCTWRRGAGRVVYFRPGHETFPTYHDPNVLRVIENACRWAAPASEVRALEFGKREAGWLEHPGG